MPPICRHAAGDPNCGSSPNYGDSYTAARDREAELKAEILKLTKAASPSFDDYEVERVEEVNGNLVLEVRYASCATCPLGGKKVLVFYDTTTKDALTWRVIDPHFRELTREHDKKRAPSPAARFPATIMGWNDALAYARDKPTANVRKSET